MEHGFVGLKRNLIIIMSKNNWLKLNLLVVLFIAASLVVLNQPRASATTISAAGITVSPAIVNLELQADQASNSFEVSLTNNTNKAISLSISSLDFKSLNDSGGLAFIGSSASESVFKHSLAAWITTPSGPVTIDSKQTKKISITIDNRADLGPGGHYAAVLYSVASEPTANQAIKVNVNEVASTLVFVSKIDGAQYSLDLTKFRVTFSWWHLPRSIDLPFTNTGNTQTAPRGLVTVSTASGREVSRGQIDTNSTLILPTSSRVYTTSLVKTGSAWWPGTYKVHVTYHSDDISQIRTADVNFTYVNLPGIAAALLAIYLVIKIYRRVIHSVVKKTRKQVKIALKKLR